MRKKHPSLLKSLSVAFFFILLLTFLSPQSNSLPNLFFIKEIKCWKVGDSGMTPNGQEKT